MHTGTLKKWALALTFWLALHMASLKAQTLPFQLTAGSGGTAVDFEWRLDGSIIEEGSGSSTLSNADLESGSRFIWYPAKAALRAGAGLGTETVSQIGGNSVAMGYQSIASGDGSTALGFDTTASGNWSTALGNSTATAEYSTALGFDTTASGDISTALGFGTTASSSASTAMGIGTLASGYYSTALGFETTASNWNSIAMGYKTTASGAYSTSTGFYTQAQAFESFAIGTCNVGGGSAGSWVATDPLFEVGNGGLGTINGQQYGNPDATEPSDALVVYKNGNADLQGTLTTGGGVMTTAASVSTTDIPMYSGD